MSKERAPLWGALWVTLQMQALPTVAVIWAQEAPKLWLCASSKEGLWDCARRCRPGLLARDCGCDPVTSHWTLAS